MEHSASSLETRPRARAVDGRALAHDASHVMTLRVKHRICGVMVGALPGFRSQDVARGLPLALAGEEAALCASRGWTVAAGERDVDASTHADVVAARVRGKRAPVSESEGTKARRRDDRGWGGGGGKAKKAAAAAGDGWTRVVAPGSFVSVPLENEHDGDAEDVGAMFPSTRVERERCAVFEALHDEGFHMTPGAKFGSDYLAYPGDPILFHAHYTVRVISWDAVVHPLVLAATTRMSHAARKNFVVACARATDDDERFETRFFTLEADVELSTNRGY